MRQEGGKVNAHILKDFLEFCFSFYTRKIILTIPHMHQPKNCFVVVIFLALWCMPTWD